jgi:hypothetical protein
MSPTATSSDGMIYFIGALIYQPDLHQAATQKGEKEGAIPSNH